MKIVFPPECPHYDAPGHPEAPWRVKALRDRLRKRGFAFVEPEPAQREDLLLAHSPTYLQALRRGRSGGPDTPAIQGIFEYACRSAGAAIRAAEIAMNGEIAFALTRPPGHHAERSKAMGFCYFNNIAIAVLKALPAVSPVAVIDVDAHHGNGIQNILYGREGTFYLSLHQSPFYPGTGLESRDNCRNFPLPWGTGPEAYLEALDEGIEWISEADPRLVVVAAGFDAHREDPLTDMGLEVETFGRIGARIAELGVPLCASLEGGYGPALADCAEAFLDGLASG